MKMTTNKAKGRFLLSSYVHQPHNNEDKRIKIQPIKILTIWHTQTKKKVIKFWFQFVVRKHPVLIR